LRGAALEIVECPAESFGVKYGFALAEFFENGR